jgi:hypothetical protein
MNTHKLKQIFTGLAKSIGEFQDTLNSEENQTRERVTSLPAIVGGAFLAPEVAAARTQALLDLIEITQPDGVWSVSSVDDIVSDFVERLVNVPRDKRRDANRAEVDEVLKRFGQSPSNWIVDCLVYGIHQDCAGVKFGDVLFVSEEMSKGLDTARDPTFPTGIQMFGRLATNAIDEESAIQRARNILDEHLMILNALCSGGAPSWIQVSRTDHMRRSYSAHRIGTTLDSMGSIQAYGPNLRVPLMRHELDGLILP